MLCLNSRCFRIDSASDVWLGFSAITPAAMVWIKVLRAFYHREHARFLGLAP